MKPLNKTFACDEKNHAARFQADISPPKSKFNLKFEGFEGL